MAMICKYSAEFAAELNAKVEKPGIKIFLGEALASLESELDNRSSGFLGALHTGRGVVLALKDHGKAQIVRAGGVESEPRFMIRFMNAPQCVLVARLAREGGQEMEMGSAPEVSELVFIAVALLVEQGAGGKAQSNVAAARRM